MSNNYKPSPELFENLDTLEESIEALCKKPNYVSNYDDHGDETYAYFSFTPLPEFRELFSIIRESK